MTIRDVAAYCGVSVSTVSRVLNGHPDVSREVRARVMDAVRTLHFVPNASARDLVRSGVDSVGVVVRGAENPFFTPIVRSMEKSLADNNCAMALQQLCATDNELKAAAELTRSKKLRGIIIVGGRFNYSAEEIGAIGVPCVCCACANVHDSMDKDCCSSVSISDRSDARRAVHMLTASGHRKIAVLTNSISDRSVGELRYRGYLQALKDADIEPDKELIAETLDLSMTSAYRKTRKLITDRPDITAIFAVTDLLAIAAIKALYDEGVRVPEDCSVIAIDGIEASLYTVPTLTALVQPQDLLGSMAVELLNETLMNQGPPRHIRLETTLREGGTVRQLL